MMAGIHKKGRVRILLTEHHKCFNPLKKGQRKRRSIRGWILGPDLSVISLVILKNGPKQIANITDKKKNLRLGPKRANKIRKMF